MRIVIKRIGRKEIQTKDGLKWNLSLLGEDGAWYSGWPSDATKDWKEGQTVDVDVSEKTVGDKTYKNFKPKPVAAAPAAPAASLASNAEVVSLLKEMVVYLKIISIESGKKQKPKKEPEPVVEMDEPPPHDDSDAPPPVDEEAPPF